MHLVVFARKLLNTQLAFETQLTSYLNEVFPELPYFFKSGLHQKFVYALLKKALTTETIDSIYMTHLAHLLKSTSHNHFDKKTAQQLRVLKRKSVYTSDNALSSQVTHPIL